MKNISGFVSYIHFTVSTLVNFDEPAVFLDTRANNKEKLNCIQMSSLRSLYKF